MFPRNAKLVRPHERLEVLALNKPVTVQSVEYALVGRVVLSLSELLKVWAQGLLNLRKRRIHRFANVCDLVSTETKKLADMGNCTETVMFPNIRLHTDSVKGVFPKEGEPRLHRLRVPILDLDQSAKGDPLEVLLALLMHKVASGDGPAFNDARKRHGTGNGKVQIIGGANGEVGEEFHILNTVRSQLEIAHREAVLRLPPKWSRVDRLYASRKSSILTKSP